MSEFDVQSTEALRDLSETVDEEVRKHLHVSIGGCSKVVFRYYSCSLFI